MQATTPMDPRALDAMMEYQLERYGNPHSRTHAYGWESEAVVEKAREQVANLIGASPKEVGRVDGRALQSIGGGVVVLVLWYCWWCRCCGTVGGVDGMVLLFLLL